MRCFASCKLWCNPQCAFSETFREAHSEVQWDKMRGFRNFVVHDYLEIDLDAVWSIVEQDLPSLAKAIEDAIQAAD
jgi:uncharacterized protein with HEPN domain